MLSAAAITPSSEPCSAIHFAAVFGPDLVDAGHVVDRVADRASGNRRYDRAARRTSLSPPSTSSRSLLIVLISVTRSSTSCARSLSPVEMTTLWPCLRGDARNRADRVVGLDAGHAQHRPAEQLHDFVDRLDLLRQRVGHRACAWPCTADTTRRGRSCPWRRTRRRRSRGLHVLQTLAQHRDHAVDGAGRKTIDGPAQVRHCVVGTIEIARTIDQQHCVFSLMRAL